MPVVVIGQTRDDAVVSAIVRCAVNPGCSTIDVVPIPPRTDIHRDGRPPRGSRTLARVMNRVRSFDSHWGSRSRAYRATTASTVTNRMEVRALVMMGGARWQGQQGVA